MSPWRGALLALLMQSGVPARAWEAKAKNVEARLRSHPHPMSVPQARMPGWARKIKRADARVHWIERFGGRDYLFGVGFVQGVDNAELRMTIAGDRARASLADALTAPGDKSAGLVLRGSQILDWHLDGEGRLYALAVVLP